MLCNGQLFILIITILVIQYDDIDTSPSFGPRESITKDSVTFVRRVRGEQHHRCYTQYLLIPPSHISCRKHIQAERMKYNGTKKGAYLIYTVLTFIQF